MNRRRCEDKCSSPSTLARDGTAGPGSDRYNSPMNQLTLKSAREVLEATAAVLVALGSLASEDEELLEGVSTTVALVMGVRDMVKENPGLDEAMMRVFVDAYTSGLVNKIEGERPEGQA